MPRSYIRTLPDLYERKAFGTDKHPPYSPGALACFVGVLCFGEQQPERGRFKSLRLLRVLLEGPKGVGRPIARAIPFLIKMGDLVERPDGSLYIEGWDELQEGDWLVAERMKRYRARKDAVTPPVTLPVTPEVTSPDVYTPSERLAVSGKHLAEAVGGSDIGFPPNVESRPDAGRPAKANGGPKGWASVGSVTDDLKHAAESGPDAFHYALSKRDLEEWNSFGPEWSEFRTAWISRGFKHPPAGHPDDDPEDESPSQRALLWSILDARPHDLPRWIIEAPGKSASQVIAWCLDHWHGLRDEVAEREEEEREAARRRRARSTPLLSEPMPVALSALTKPEVIA